MKGVCIYVYNHHDSFERGPKIGKEDIFWGIVWKLKSSLGFLGMSEKLAQVILERV